MYSTWEMEGLGDEDYFGAFRQLLKGLIYYVRLSSTGNADYRRSRLHTVGEVSISQGLLKLEIPKEVISFIPPFLAFKSETSVFFSFFFPTAF